MWFSGSVMSSKELVRGLVKRPGPVARKPCLVLKPGRRRSALPGRNKHAPRGGCSSSVHTVSRPRGEEKEVGASSKLQSGIRWGLE